MSLTIRPLNSGYIPTKPLEYWYHFSCKKYVEKMGITNESDQLPDMTFLIEGGDQLILVDCRVAFGGMTEAEKANNAEALVGKNAMSGFLALMNAAPEDIEKVSGAVNN